LVSPPSSASRVTDILPGLAALVPSAGFGLATPQPRHRIRVGVVIPKLESSLNTTAGAAELLRSSLVSYLSGPAVDIQLISSMLPPQITMEASDKACDFVLYSGLAVKKGGGLMDGLVGRAAPLVGLTPIGAIGNAAGAIAGGKKQGAPAVSAAELAKSLKSKDEVHFEFTLRDAHRDNAPLANAFSAQASKGGEDVITPLAAQVAEAVVTYLLKSAL
jgi:hypothetical protein